jgi:hypothetical protein
MIASRAGYLQNAGYFVTWNKLETPDGIISDIYLSKNNEIIIVDENKAEYKWNYSQWMIIDSTNRTTKYNNCISLEDSGFFVKKPPFIPIKRFSINCFSGDLTDHMEFALSERNEVWYWRMTVGDLSFITYFGYIGVALFCSLLTLIIFIIILFLPSIKKDKTLPNPRLQPTWPSSKR